jgi:hypothetical protein
MGLDLELSAASMTIVFVHINGLRGNSRVSGLLNTTLTLREAC